MREEIFHQIYENDIVPFIHEIDENNSLIKSKDLRQCEKEILERYKVIRKQYKEVIFGKNSEQLLDRHKVASNICGAFLYVSIYDKTALINELKRTKQPVEAFFYYVNELVAFYAGYRFLSFYMSYGREDGEKAEIIEKFPIIPPSIKNKNFRGLSSILFNLSQINDENQIGIEKYDKYSYAMFYFMLENYFYLKTGINAKVSDK